MKKIYVLTSGSYSDYRIHGVYDSEEEICKYFEGGKDMVARSDYTVEEFELNKSPDGDKVMKTLFCAKIYAVDWAPRYGQTSAQVAAGQMEDYPSTVGWASPGERGGHTLEDVDQEYFNRFSGCDFFSEINASSFVSQEHARKLCVEGYQKYLALKGGVV
jgi:hypothetical protein